jgi:putative protease
VKIPELVIPAGDLEKLRTAVRFGADAVYIGGGDYSLRTIDTSFTLEEVETGVKFAHERGVKVYLALNIFPYDQDIEKMLEYLGKAVPLGIDAVIVSDPGMVHEILQRGLGIKIHLSTQANTTNTSAIRFWANQGVERIVLARELNLLQIGEMVRNAPEMELEVFVHGAMCMAYSGRCLLSKHFTGREANRGECVHPCRWKYYLTEEEDTRRLIEVETGEQGTYILNAKDLCMIEHIPELIKTGVAAFKVEGRMKSPYYVAIVTKIYRQAIDMYCTDPEHYTYDPDWLKELENISHRPHGTGFYFGENMLGDVRSAEKMQNETTGGYIKRYDFVGTVLRYEPGDKTIVVQVRNRVKVGDTLDIIDPHRAEILSFTVTRLADEHGQSFAAVHNQYVARIPCPYEVSAYSLLRVPHIGVTVEKDKELSNEDA